MDKPRRLVTHQTATTFTNNFAENLRRVQQGTLEIIITKYGYPVANFGPANKDDYEAVRIFEAGGGLDPKDVLEFISKYRDVAIQGHDMRGAEALNYLIDEFKDKFI